MNNNPHNRQQGWGLLECLIATGLAAWLMLSVWQVLWLYRSSYREVNQQLAEGFDFMLIASMLRDRIRHAGFTPCGAVTHLVTQPALPAYEISKHATQITFNRMSSPYDQVSVLTDWQLHLASGHPMSLNRPYLLADCFHAERIAIIQQVAGSILLARSLHFHYVPPTYIGEWLSESFNVVDGKGLMYRARRQDVLSREITGFHVEQEKQILRLQLQTHHLGMHEVTAAMRMP